MMLGPPRETLLPLVQKAAIQNLDAKISVDAGNRPRKSTELRNLFEHLAAICKASIQGQ